MSHKLVSLYIGDGEYYTRTDAADNVIAELKAREDVLVTDNRNLLDKVKKLENLLRENAEHFKRNEAQILENAEKEIRHHKYKRCLAMAKRCLWNKLYWRDSIPAYSNQFKWENRVDKWHKRWLAIAEKFKPNKEAK